MEVAGSNVDILGQFKTFPEGFQRSVPRFRKILKLFMCLCVYNSCRKFNLATFQSLHCCDLVLSKGEDRKRWRNEVSFVDGTGYILYFCLWKGHFTVIYDLLTP